MGREWSKRRVIRAPTVEIPQPQASGPKILEQLHKDEEYLRLKDPVIWAVESAPSRAILRIMDEFHWKYEDKDGNKLFNLLNADGQPFEFSSGSFNLSHPGWGTPP